MTKRKLETSSIVWYKA